MRLIINGKEVTNPVVKFFIGTGTILVAVMFFAFIVFVILPLLGIALTISVGIITVFLAALIFAVLWFSVGAGIMAMIVAIFNKLLFRQEDRKHLEHKD